MTNTEELLSKVTPLLAEMEDWRLDLRKKSKKSVLIGAGLFALGLLLIKFYGFIAMIAGIIWALIGHFTSVSKFKKGYKAKVLPVIVENLEQNMKYAPNDFIREDEFRASELFLRPLDRYQGEDLFTGHIGKTELVFCEIHAQYKQQSSDGKSDHYVTIFKGIFMMVEFNKHFTGKTVVLPDNSERIFGKLGRKFQKWNWGRDKLVVLEDPDFEKQFVVYGTDQVESRYILTPSFMERIKSVRARTGDDIHLSFKDSTLFIALNKSSNFFEVRFSDALTKNESIHKIIEELSFCFKIVEELDLNTRIWSKS